MPGPQVSARRVASTPLAEHLLNKGKGLSERNLESSRANSRQLSCSRSFLKTHREPVEQMAEVVATLSEFAMPSIGIATAASAVPTLPVRRHSALHQGQGLPETLA